MKRNIFAVCDLEVAYAYNFMEYLNQKRTVPFEIQAFTKAEHVCQFAKDQPIELLLISDKAMCEEIKQLAIGQIMILSEGVHNPELDQYPSVYKYQSSDAVVREVMAYYAAERTPVPLDGIVKKPMKIIGVYSPVGRSLKTSFALTAGQILAKDYATLYMNLEEYSGFEELFHTNYEHNLSDLLYYLRQENEHITYKLSGMVHSFHNLDYLPPVLSPADIQNTTYEEWMKLISEISRHSTYEILLLDLGDGINDLYNFMDVCSIIYMPILSDVMSTAKIKQFENVLRMWDCVPVIDKIRKIKLPYHNHYVEREDYVEQLVWSEFGDYTREILRKDVI